MFEAPSEPNFIYDESHNNWGLLMLLVKREKLIDEIIENGVHDSRDTTNAYYEIAQEIARFKMQNDIPSRPALTPEDMKALESWVEESNT